VKQGDPTSPDLFGIFIETLADFIDALDRHQLPLPDSTTGQLLQPLSQDTPLLDGADGPRRAVSALFADDVNLVATSLQRLQYLLAALALFSDAFGMRVNVGKCEILVFHRDPSVRASLAAVPVLYKGNVIKPTERTRYLGLHYGIPPSRRSGPIPRSTPLFTDCHIELLAAGQKATHALRAKLTSCRVHVPTLVMQHWNCSVRSVLSYGAQVWASGHLVTSFDAAQRDPMVVEQRRWLQRMVGAFRPCSATVYMELSQLPLQHHWATLVLRFWNTLVHQRDSVYHAAFRSDIRMGLVRSVGWFHDVLKFLKDLGYDQLPNHNIESFDSLVDWYSTHVLPVNDLLSAMADKLMGIWNTPGLALMNPRTYTGPGHGSICRYLRQMGLPNSCAKGDGSYAALPHTWLALPAKQHTGLMRFRVGSTAFAANQHHLGRAAADCICVACQRSGRGSHIEDEKHVLMECPEYAAIRAAFAHSLPFSGGDMLEVMNCDNQRALA
jgi:hypothetical protein